MMMQMQAIFKKLRASGRGAIAMIFALCLLPIVLVIGLAIDYSFYVQAKQQVSRAAEAAATQAVRTAAAGYSLAIDNGADQTTATSNAISEGVTAGQQWFTAQAGRLVSGSAATTSVSVSPTPGAANGGAGFSSTVKYAYTYPPFFNSLFNRSTPWIYSNTSTAQAVFQYVEVLLLLDTSGSMQIGADTTDIEALSDNSVCFPSYITDTLGDTPLGNYDNGTVDFSSLVSPTGVLTYISTNGQTPTQSNGKCNVAGGYGVPINGNTDASGNLDPSLPGAPCAFACHTTTSTFTANKMTYDADPYGYARYLGKTLRLDVVVKAAEQVAQELYNAQQTPGQFSLGVYQFNTDVSTMVDGTASDGTPAEATTDLTGAKSTIETYDYTAKGNAALLPGLLTNSNPNTNFPLAITHLLNGASTTINGSTTTTTTTKSGSTTTTETTVDQITTVVPKLGQVNANAGATATNPVKNIFIVTDGLEDFQNPSTSSGLTIDFGEMTSSTAETYYTKNGTSYSGDATGYCSELKQRGFTVYVLYVPYNPLPFVAYYAPYLNEQANYADATDYPSAFTYGASGAGTNVYPEVLTQPTIAQAETIGTNPDESSTTNDAATSGEVSPTEEALQACANSGDFYIATDSGGITSAITAMLQKAITSSIVVTQVAK